MQEDEYNKLANSTIHDLLEKLEVNISDEILIECYWDSVISRIRIDWSQFANFSSCLYV